MFMRRPLSDDASLGAQSGSELADLLVISLGPQSYASHRQNLKARFGASLLGQIFFEVLHNRSGNIDRLRVATTALAIVFGLEFHPVVAKVGVNLDELWVPDFFAGLEVQFTGKYLFGSFRVVKWHSVFSADDRPVIVDLARSVFQRGASETQAKRRKASPCVGNLVVGQELFPILQIFLCALLDLVLFFNRHVP